MFLVSIELRITSLGEDEMSRTILIMVSDNHEQIETAKKYWENHDVTFQVYSPSQWREGLDSTFFRQQLMQGLPALVSGTSPLSHDSNQNVVAFGSDGRVQKMDQLEAKAIEDAINQYKGNLTEAAKALGIGRATLYRKVKAYQIDPSNARKKKIAAA
jgi:DNA-binding NtrC family response regulator